MTFHFGRRCLLVLASCCYCLNHASLALLSVHRPFTRLPSRNRHCLEGNKNNDGGETSRSDTVSYLDSVTDAEALLACRAYLQRKNRLGSWKDYHRRKESLRQASNSVGAADASESVGFFWENPNELVYLDKQHDENDDYDDEYSIGDGENTLQDEKGARIIFESSPEEGEGTIALGATTLSALERGAEFSSFPTSPSQERLRRSNAAKRRWSDPEWKAMWYEKRWGRLRNTTPAAAKQKRLDEKIRSVPPRLFESEELAALTEEEIEGAIRTYVVSNQKRSRAHTTDARMTKKKQAAQEESERRRGKEPPAKIDLMTMDNANSDAMMKEAQRRRSERAAKAYLTRLANQNQSARTRQPIPTDVLPCRLARHPSSETPKNAIVRVQAALECNQLPSVKDVELIVQPLRLGRRKDLLRRILNEHFDLRGKCVPANSSNEQSELLFVTQCSIDRLGSFVVKQMKTRLDDGLHCDQNIDEIQTPTS